VGRLCEFRQSKIENLYLTLSGDEDIGGLYIAMHNAVTAEAA